MPILVAGSLSPTNVALLRACRELSGSASLVPPTDLARRIAPGDAVLARLDVRPSLLGVEPGLDMLRRIEAVGFPVANCADDLLVAHDKLATAAVLRRAGVPHPRTAHVTADGPAVELEPPVVVKPRFGSWGRDVVRCDTHRELARTLRRVRRHPWFRTGGALVQELVPPRGHDLRLIVAGGTVVGAIRRFSPPGEWRTNVALGAERRSVVPDGTAVAVALAAAAASGLDLVGVDLLPVVDGYVVVELNGCVDFCDVYAPSSDIFFDAMRHVFFPEEARVFDDLSRALGTDSPAQPLPPDLRSDR
jgi:RimK family alpha-L-glutamate ligase